MKKLLCLLLVAAGSYTVQAQGFRAGPKVGVNYSKAWNEVQEVGPGDVGGQLGGILNGSFDKKGKNVMQVEMLLAMRSFHNTPQNAKLNTTYIDLPVMYQYNFVPSRKRGRAYSIQPTGNFYATAGTQLSILLSSKATFPGLEAGGAPINVHSWTRPFDMSAQAGVGYKFSNGLNLEARYGLGLRHLHGAPCAIVPFDASLNSIQASVAYALPVKFQTRK